MTLEELRAKEILEHHRGRANALQVRHFAQLLGVEERRAQLRHRLGSLAHRIASIERISVEEVYGQMRMEGTK